MSCCFYSAVNCAYLNKTKKWNQSNSCPFDTLGITFLIIAVRHHQSKHLFNRFPVVSLFSSSSLLRQNAENANHPFCQYWLCYLSLARSDLYSLGPEANVLKNRSLKIWTPSSFTLLTVLSRRNWHSSHYFIPSWRVWLQVWMWVLHSVRLMFINAHVVGGIEFACRLDLGASSVDIMHRETS